MNLTFLRFQTLQKFFQNDWEHAFRANISDLLSAGIDKKGIENFFQNQKNISPDLELERLQKCGAHALVFGEKNFPISLSHIASPPAILFARGEILDSDFPAIAVVGSRNISSYGRRALETLIAPLARAGITIVSGLALGADILAHRIAVQNGGRTICVLGNGIDQIYPRTNQAFAEKILHEKKGAILSEYFPGIEPRPEYFPVRNRLIAGLSRATIVIEAAEGSGSLITAELANEQGREVFAVPGEIFSKNSAGTNQLIASGAYPALSAAQILAQLGIDQKLGEQQKIKQDIPLTEVETEILRLFGAESRVHINDLMHASALPGPVVSSHISIMELKGLVKNLGNQMYSKNC